MSKLFSIFIHVQTHSNWGVRQKLIKFGQNTAERLLIILMTISPPPGPYGEHRDTIRAPDVLLPVSVLGVCSCKRGLWVRECIDPFPPRIPSVEISTTKRAISKDP